jgi:transcriptional regulator with XRE-family HTH domain
MENHTFTYTVKAPHIPTWSIGERLRKCREDVGMNMKEFSKFTALTWRQIQYAENGLGNVSDVVITVVAAKTGVDYYWIKTGEIAKVNYETPDNASALMGASDGEESLPGLDSNQEPIGSFLSLPIRDLMKDILLPRLNAPCIKIKPDPLPMGLAA